MSGQWIYLCKPDVGVQPQWQYRRRDRSIAVLTLAMCTHPRCDCPTHVYGGQRRNVVDCARNFYGVIIGPDGLVLDVELGQDARLDDAQRVFEDALRGAGWRL
jgi:hypothetical protein